MNNGKKPIPVRKKTERVRVSLSKHNKIRGSAGDLFLKSVETLTPDDIILNTAMKNKKKKEPDFLRFAMLFICASVFIYTVYALIDRVAGYAESEMSNKRFQDIFYGNDTVIDIDPVDKPYAFTPMTDFLAQQFQVRVSVSAEISDRVELKKAEQTAKNVWKLQEHNSDMKFWLVVPGTNIDYPVVQTTNNDYYLYYNFEKKKDPSGAIFLDYRNSANVEENYNTVIYGHNMRSNTMFRALCYFGDYEWMFMDGKIELHTAEKTYIYQVFSVYVCEPDYGYIRKGFETPEEFVTFVTLIEANSIFRRPDFTITPEDKIVTLSTCAISALDQRFAVHGKLVEIIDRNPVLAETTE